MFIFFSMEGRGATRKKRGFARYVLDIDTKNLGALFLLYLVKDKQKYKAVTNWDEKVTTGNKRVRDMLPCVLRYCQVYN